jgi:hypothetical protein
VSFFTRLEFVKHYIQGCVMEDKINIILVVLAHHRQRGIVIRINKHEILDKEYIDDVCSICVVNWYPKQKV